MRLKTCVLVSEICCRGLLFTLIGRTDFSSDDAIWRPRSSRWYLSHCRRESDWVLGFNEATLYDDALFWDEWTEEDVDRLTSEEFRPQVRSSILVAFITIFYKKKIFLVHKKNQTFTSLTNPLVSKCRNWQMRFIEQVVCLKTNHTGYLNRAINQGSEW